MPLMLRAGSSSLQGGHRADNEDFVAVEQWHDRIACVVADGMGGAGLGSQASQRAAAVLLAGLDKLSRDCAGSVEIALRQAFGRAQQEVRALLSPQGQYVSCTATLLLWLFGADHVHLAHIGDTCAFHLHAGRVTILTAVHDIIHVLVAGGTITEEQARSHHRIRNVLYRYLGMDDGNGPFPGPDLVRVPIHGTGDCFLLCSDGLSNYLTMEEIPHALQAAGDPQQRAAALCQLALDRGSRDNVSAIVIDGVEATP
jgi:serine/threonine protein phosphatase PrpC